MKILEVYTDGSASPNPGKGAWAYCIVEQNKPSKIATGYVEEATNNQMELQAVIEALKYIDDKNEMYMIYIYTDSQYVERGINVWMKKWKRNNWNVKNPEMWKEIHERMNGLVVQAQWIRGHSKNKWND